MSLDEPALSAQRAVDRLIRRLRRGAAPSPTHRRLLESKQAARRRGILHGGSACANNNLFSFISLTRPKGASVLNALSAFVVAGWVFVKSLTQTILEVARVGLCLIADPFGEVGRWRWLTIKIGVSVWVRRFFTMAAARDLYAGVPRIYVLDTVASLHADALDHRFPGLAEDLSKSRGIGFVLARSESGPVYFWRGQRYQLGLAEPGPFARRAGAGLVLQAS